MVKVGDQVVVVDAPNDRSCDVGDVLNVFHIANAYGFWARSINGGEYYVRMAEADGYAEVIVRPYTETEAEFVAWEDAPEELKYDASRVYYGGKPVKWIAKPGGILTADVTYITRSGIIRCSAEALTVKL